jgi:hypothetical protein
MALLRRVAVAVAVAVRPQTSQKVVISRAVAVAVAAQEQIMAGEGQEVLRPQPALPTERYRETPVPPAHLLLVEQEALLGVLTLVLVLL